MPLLQNDAYELVPVGRLIPHPQNVNEGDYGAIEASIKENGFFGVLVVQRSTRHILAGNHRYLVAQKLGYSELPVTWIDVDDDRARRVLLVDNRTSRLGVDNPAKLAELLAEIQNETDTLSGTGYSTEFLDELLKDLERGSVFTTPPEPPPATEETRPGVIVLCETQVEQENVYRRLVEMGWDPRKTDVTEKSLTTLSKKPR